MIAWNVKYFLIFILVDMAEIGLKQTDPSYSIQENQDRE